MEFMEMLAFWGVPVGITGLFFWLIQRRLDKRDKKREQDEIEKERKALEREHHREKLLLLINQSVRAVTVLSEATARAVQRIPDAKCNGDMTNALKYVKEVQTEQKDFLMELGIHSIYDTGGSSHES
jgi:hypothetical protein